MKYSSWKQIWGSICLEPNYLYLWHVVFARFMANINRFFPPQGTVGLKKKFTSCNKMRHKTIRWQNPFVRFPGKFIYVSDEVVVTLRLIPTKIYAFGHFLENHFYYHNYIKWTLVLWVQMGLIRRVLSSYIQNW